MTCITCGNGSARLVMLHDRGELRTDFGPLWLTVAYHAPCQQQQGQGIGKRLIAAQADGDLAGVIDDLAARLR